MDTNFLKIHNPTNAAPAFAGKSPAGALRQPIQVARPNIDLARFGFPRTLIVSDVNFAQLIMIAALFDASAMGGYWMELPILGILWPHHAHGR